MNYNVLFPFLLTIFAGFSTMIGMFPIFFKFKNQNKIIAMSLIFAGFVMSFVSIKSLIPESMIMLTNKYNFMYSVLICALFFVIGIIFSMMIDRKMDTDHSTSNHLYKVGIISMLAIIMHNIPEGVATFMAGSTNKSLGLSLAIAISLHNIPEGVSISVPIYYSTKSKKKAFLYTFISALSEPFGAILAYLFLSRFMSDMVMGCLLAFIAGIMIHIAIYELFPTAKKYLNSNYRGS